MGRKRSLLALLAALALAGCSSEERRAEPVEPAPPATTRAAAVPPAPAVEPDRAPRVYAAYYRHCKEFTWQALVFPRTARNPADAASQYAGPPRQYRKAAFDGCLAGLRENEGRITVADIKRALAEEAAEHGGEG